MKGCALTVGLEPLGAVRGGTGGCLSLRTGRGRGIEGGESEAFPLSPIPAEAPKPEEDLG